MMISNRTVPQSVVTEIHKPVDLSVVAIIALHNGAEFIERSLTTVLSQTRPADEILVIDDGSTDDGPQIVERMIADHPHARLIHKENGGQSSARNLGVASSKSALIALLDQDDGWYPDHLEKLLVPYEKGEHFRLGWVYSDLDRCDRYGRLHTTRMLRGMPARHPKRTLTECLSQDMFILPSASLISRTAFESVGGFDERLSGYEEDDLFLRLFFAGWENVFLPKALSFWCIYPGSTSYSPRMSRSRRIYFQKLREMFRDDPMSGDLVGTVITPRFIPYFIREDLASEKTGDVEAYRHLTEEAQSFLQTMQWGRKRLVFEIYFLVRRVPFLRRLVSERRALAIWRRVRGRIQEQPVR